MTFIPRPLAYFLNLSLFQKYIAVIKFVFAVHFFTTHVGHIALTEGPSMLPTIGVRGVQVYIDNTYSRGRGLKVGDVVDYDHPIVQGVRAIKRIAGMPGDFVVKEQEDGKGKMMVQVRHSSIHDEKSSVAIFDRICAD